MINILLHSIPFFIRGILFLFDINNQFIQCYLQNRFSKWNILLQLFRIFLPWITCVLSNWITSLRISCYIWFATQFTVDGLTFCILSMSTFLLPEMRKVFRYSFHNFKWLKQYCQLVNINVMSPAIRIYQFY